MKKSRAFLFLYIFIVITIFPLFAANQATAERYMTSANEQYSLENFSKAYTYINYVLEQYDEKTVTLQVKLLAELIYYDYLGEIEKNEDLTAFKAYQDSVNDFPYIVSDRIQKKLDSLVPVFQKKAADEESKRKAAQAQAAQTQATTQRTQTQAAATQQSNAETIAEIRSSNEELAKKIEKIEQLIITQETQNQVQQIRNDLSNSTQEIRKASEENESGTRLLIFILIGVIVVMIIVIISIIILVLRMSNRQKELFTTTLRIVSEIKKLPLEISNTTTLRIEDKYNELRKIQEEAVAAAATAEPAQTPEEDIPVPPSIPPVADNDITEDLRAELRELANKCEEQGIKIDKHTGRKNNSRKIAELVFKIAKEMELGEYYSMLYFCASMVYDIGFLDLKADQFESGPFNDELKEELKSHVHTGVERLDFIPDKFRPLFVDAVCMHHENQDGSGYPDGIKGKRIPDIARIIHVIETYIALTSKRSYHNIVDSETALETLKNAPDKYDKDIVVLLEDLI